MRIGVYGIKFNPDKLNTFQNLFSYLKTKLDKNIISIYSGLYKQLIGNIKEIDGFLIGGASKSSKKFIDIIKNYYR